MILDDGIVRYKEPNFDIASFPEQHLHEIGVDYFRDYQYRLYRGWVLVEYEREVNGCISDNHVYLRREEVPRARDLMDHWSRGGYSFTIAKIHHTDPLATV